MTIVYLKTGKGYREITQAHIDRVAKRIKEQRQAKYWSGDEDLETSKQGGRC